jgi:hypothetical protein
LISGANRLGGGNRIREILERFHGDAEEEAFFELLEMPGDVLPALTAAFRAEQDPAGFSRQGCLGAARSDGNSSPD